MFFFKTILTTVDYGLECQILQKRKFAKRAESTKICTLAATETLTVWLATQQRSAARFLKWTDTSQRFRRFINLIKSMIRGRVYIKGFIITLTTCRTHLIQDNLYGTLEAMRVALVSFHLNSTT